jgi:trigger factor
LGITLSLRRMKVELKEFKTENYQAQADVFFTKDEVNEYFQNAYRSFLPLVQVPGFRKGKVPMDIAKQYLNQEKLLEEVIEKMVYKSIDILNQNKTEHDFIYPPSLNSEIWPVENEEYTLKMLVDFFPEIDFTSLDSLNIPIEVPKSKNDIEKELINSLLDANASFKEIENQAQMGHYAFLEYSYNFESEHPKFYPTMIELGKNQILPDIDQEIMQMKPGDEKTFTHTPPDQDPISIKIRLTGIKEKLLPSLEQTLLDNLNINKSIDEYKAEVSEQAEKSYNDYVKDVKWGAFFEEWFKDHTIEQLPSSILDHYMDQTLNIFEQDLSESKLSLEEFYAKSGKTEEELMEQLKPKAVSRANVDLIIRSILRQNPELTPKENEVDEETQQYLGKYKDGALDKKKVREYCDSLIRRKNALNWLMSKVSFTEKK